MFFLGSTPAAFDKAIFKRKARTNETTKAFQEKTHLLSRIDFCFIDVFGEVLFGSKFQTNTIRKIMGIQKTPTINLSPKTSPFKSSNLTLPDKPF
jgi:hypothetical protein